MHAAQCPHVADLPVFPLLSFQQLMSRMKLLWGRPIGGNSTSYRIYIQLGLPRSTMHVEAYITSRIAHLFEMICKMSSLHRLLNCIQN